jgi:hypothetical protein
MYNVGMENSTPIPQEELEKLEDFISNAQWREASTFRNSGYEHSYALRKVSRENALAIDALIQAIERFGFDSEFFGTPQRYLWVGEYKYWYYDNTLVNREHRSVHMKRNEK